MPETDARPDRAPKTNDDEAGSPVKLPTEGCSLLPDLSIPNVSDPDAGSVLARLGEPLGCSVPDGGAGAQHIGTVYSRRDGQPMVEKGKTYSLRWSSDTFMVRMRLVGGSNQCTDHPLGFAEPASGLTAGAGVAVCSDFHAPETADHVRLYGHGLDFWSLSLLRLDVDFALCPGACPANTKVTMPAPADAGIP